MIRIRHFAHERDGKSTPDWKDAEELLNKEDVGRILNVTAYPTGMAHNLVVIFEEKPDKDGPEETKEE